jgi:AraC-like DNA-binding protein
MSNAAEILLPRRGVFVVHRGREAVAVDPNTALVLGAGDEYRVSHPADGGDLCTVLAVAPELLEETLGDRRGRHGFVRPQTQLLAHRLAATLRRGADALEAEEAACGLLAAAAADLARLPPARPATRRRVDDVRALLAAEPAAAWRLDEIARRVHCSPFHLARQFRATTGETVGRYLLRLRLGIALERLAGGETSLTRLAHELGFAHHSHFSARFRSVLGLTPSRVRTIVTAGAEHAP